MRTSHIQRGVAVPRRRSVATALALVLAFVAASITLVSSPASAAAPTTPTLPVVIQGDAKLFLYWTQPATANPVLDYQIKVWAGNSATNAATGVTGATTRVVGSNKLTYVFTGLTNGTNYSFTIASCDTLGCGGANSASTTYTGQKKPIVPPAFAEQPAVSSVVGTSGSATSLTVVFPTVPDGGAAISNFKYSFDVTTWTAVSPVTTASPVVITGLTANTAYSVSIRGVNSKGDGFFSDPVRGYTNAAAPTAVSAGSTTSTSTSIGFTAPSGTVSNYEYSLDNGSTWVTPSPAVTATPLAISGLSSNTAYSIKIRAVGASGSGGVASSTVSVTTLPGAPGSFALSQVDNDSTRLTGSFTVPTGAATISGYKYRINSGAWTSLSPSISNGTGTFTLTGLDANTSYTVDLLATSTAGDGASASASNTTVPAAPTVPVASAVPGDATQLSVAFTAPSGTVSGYEFSTDNGSTWSTATGTSSPITLSGLTADTSYTQLKIRAVNGSSKGAASAAFSGATVLATPMSPVASGIAGDGTQLSVALTAPSGTITKYQFSTDNGSTWADATGTSSPITLTGLTPNTVYSQLKVRAVGAAGAGAASVAFSGTTVPGTPSTVAVTSASSTSSSLTVSFAAPAGPATITGYEYQLNGGTWTALTSEQVSALSLTLTGLASNTSHTVSVRAVNAGGAGPGSQVSGTTLPAAPTSFTVTPVDGDSTSMSASFAVPSGPASITGYEYRIGSGSWTSLSPSISAGTGTFTITGVSANTNYTVELRASNSAGTGDTAQASADTALAAPTAISVSGVEGDGTKLTVAFTEPAGSPTGYEFSKDGGATWSTAVQIASPVTLTGLAPGTLHTELQIRAAKGLVRGSPTDTFSGTTTPGGPTISSISNATDTSFQVAFTLPADTPTPTGLQYSTDGGSTWTTAGSTSSPITITGLDAGTAYSVRLRAVNAIGAGTASAAVTGATIPAAPTNPVASSVAGSPTTLSVAFTAPAGTITGYQYSKDAGATWTTAAQATSPITVSNLSANTTYTQLRIRALTAGGEGAATANFGGTTVPGAPGIGEIHSETSTSFEVPFTPYTGGTETIVRHEYSIHPDEWFTIAAGDVTDGSFTVTGLDTNTFHTVHVRAVSAAGAGSLSAGAEATTTPGAPTALTASGVNGDSTRLSVSLTAPGGEAAITGYQYQVDGGSWVLAVQTASPITVTGLSAGATYSLKVRALNHAGVGAETAAFSGTTVLAAATALVATPIDGSSSTASIAFDAPSGSPTGYEYSIDGGTSWTTAAESSSPITVAGLTANSTNGQLLVRAVDAAGKGEASSASSVTTVAGAPSSLSVNGVAGTPGSVEVSFTAPAGTGTITDYEYKVGTGTWTSASDDASPLVITGLTGNTGYSVVVRAVTAAGKGAASSSASGTTVPTAPTLDSVIETASSFVVTFSAPSGGDATITGYQYSHDSGASWEDLTSAEVSDGEYTVTELDSNTSYPVWLRAVNSGGGGSYASESAITLPGVPTITGVSGTTENGFSVAFTAVSGTATIDRYEYSIDSGSSWSHLSSAEVSAGSFDLAALAANTVYNVSLRAVNVSGDGAQASTSATTLAPAPVVSSAVGVAGEPTELSVAFTQPTGGSATITAYEYSTNGNNWTAITGTTSPLTLTGLSANTAYTTLRLRAVNAGGNGTASDVFSGTTTAEAPTVTGFSSVSTTGFSIAFTGPSGTAVSTYEYSLDGGSTWVDAASTSSPIAVTGLSANTAYSVKVRPVTLTVAGVASATSTGTTLADAPTSVTASSVAGAATELSVAFTAPTGGGATIVQYEFSTDGGANWSTATGTESPVTLTGLTGSTAYTQLQLRAVNAGGNGTATADLSGNTVPAAPTLPSAASVDGSSTILRVSFTPVAGGGLPITGYEFQRDGSATWFSATTVTASSIDLTGLSANTAYTALKIRAVSADGAGPATAAFSGSTVLAAPSSPEASVVPGTSNQLSVAFTAPSGTVTGYEFSTDGGGTWATATGTASPVTLAGLDANTAYLRLQLRAVNGTGKGAATANFSGTTAPAAPTIDSITAASSTSLTVTFSAPNAPLNTEPATITDYEYSTDGGTTWKARNTTGTTSPLTITLTSTASATLASNTSYSVKIRAVNAGGSGVASATTTASTLAAAPTSPVATAVTGDSARLSVAFTAPTGAGTVTKYEFSTDGGSTWATATGTTSPVVLTGLNPNTAYAALQLRAVTAAGNGDATSSFSGTTVPSAPSITSITAAGTTSLTVNFTAPNNGASTSPATVTNYEYSTDGGTTWRVRSTTGTTSPLTITGTSATGAALTSNTSYSVKLRAVNAGGAGEASAATSGLTLSAAPTSPVASGVAGQPTQLSVSFTAPTGVGTITGYEFSKDGGSTWVAATGTSSPVLLTGLTGGTAYTTLLQIRAVTAAGSGTATSSFTGTTVPAAPTITSITGASTTSLTVNITVPAGTASGWQYSTDGTNWKAGTVSSGVMTISQTSAAGTTALSINTAYSVTVRMNSSAGTGATSAAVTGTTLPAAPTVASAAALAGDGTKALITLNAPTGTATITGYKFSLNNGSTWADATVVSSTSINLTGMSANTAYGGAGKQIKIQAVNAGGLSANSATVSVTTSPDAPTAGAASAITSSSFSIAVTNNTGGGSLATTNYQYSTDGGTTWTTRSPAATTSPIAISGLSANTTYSVRLRAVSTAGAGSPSTAVSVSTLAGAPTGMSASAVPGASSTLSVSFTAPSGNATVVKYQFSTNGGSLFSDAVGTSSPITITGLTANTTYSNLVIRMVNAGGAGATSAVFSGTTGLGAPTGLSVSGNTKNSFSVAFTAPAGTVTGYEVSTDAGTTWVDAGTSTSPISVTGLTANTTYDVKVRATSAAGSGDASATASGTTLADAPTINSVSAVNGDGSKLLVSFTPPQGEATRVGVRSAVITGYEFSLNGTTWTSATSVSSTSVYVTGLTPNTEYTTLQLRAVNGAGGGIASAYFGGTTTLGAPTIDSVVAVSSTELTVTISPAVSGAETVQNYEYSTNGGISFTAVSPASTATTVTIAGLTANTSYSVVVRAVNSNGAGTPSASATGTTYPGAPTLLTVSPVSGDGSRLSVAFTAPTGSAAILAYEYRLDGGSWTIATGTSSPIVISDLVDNTTYGVELRATNAGGTGTESNSVSGATALAAPTITGTTSSATTSLAVSFTAPSVGTVVNYQYSTNGGTTWTTRSPVSDLSPLTITGLVANTTYSVKVRAVDGNGVAGSASVAVDGTTLVGTATIGTITGSSTTGLSVPFTAPTGTGTISNYEYSTDGGSTWTTRSPASNASPISISGLAANTAYSVRIRAINTAGTGAASTVATGTTLADAPTLTAYAATVAKAVTMTLTAPGGTATITGYEYSINGGTTFVSATMSGLTFSIASLADNTDYSVLVRAVNAGGKGPWSAAFGATTLPSAVAGQVAAAFDGDGTKVKFTFTTAPTGNSTILGYQLSRDNKATWETSTLYQATLSGGVYTIALTGFVSSTTVSGLSVRAVNAAGASLSGTGQKGATTVPAAPTISSVAAASSSSVSVGFTAPAVGGGEANYNYEYSLDGGATWIARSPVALTSPLAITGLTPNTSYNLQLRATNASGVGKGAATPATSFTTAPAAPTAVTATGVAGDPTKLSVAFTKPSGTVSGYQYSTNGGTNWTTASESESPIVITGLTANTAYTNLKVRAVAAGGNGDATAAFSATTTLAAPTLATAALGETSVRITATPPAGTVTGYQYSTNEGATWSSTVSSPFTISSLSANSDYTVQVRAINSAGIGGATATITSTTLAAAAVAGTVESPSTTAFDVPFTLPVGGTSSITNIEYSTDGGSTWTTRAPASTQSPVTIAGLSSNTLYSVKVRAVNAAGAGAASGSTSGTTLPGAPTSVTVTAVNGDSTKVTVGFTAPTGNATLTGYEYRLDGTADWVAASMLTATTFRISGLASDTSYPAIQVRALNSAGAGAASTAAAGVTVPVAPTVSGVSRGSTTVTVTYAAPSTNGGSAITSYLVYAYTDAAGTTLVTGVTNPQTDSTVDGCSTTSASCSYTFTGLTNGSTYWFRLVAVTGAGDGEVSAVSGSAKPATVPDAPVITTPNPGNTTVEVHWSTPVFNGGEAIDHFDVYAYTDAAGTELATVSGSYSNPQQVSGAATVKTIFQGLTNLTPYYFRVVAHNVEGDSSPSGVSEAATPLPVSDPPTDVVGTPGNQQVLVSWTPPVHQGVSALSAYKVYVYSDAETQVQVGSAHTVTGSPLPSSYTVTGLDNGTPYWFEVAAVNEQGTSMNSAESASVTPRTVPDVPTGVTGAQGVGSITVSWTAPDWNGGSPITAYRLYTYSNAEGTTQVGSTAVITGSPVPTSKTVTGLTNGSAYWFKVVAVNAAGDSAATALSDGYEPYALPLAPGIGAPTSGNTQLTAAWTALTPTTSRPVEGYRVYVYSNSGGTTLVEGITNPVLVTGSSTTSVAVTGLTNGTRYWLRVAGYNDAGEGAKSSVSAAVTPSTIPDAPTPGSLTSGSTQVTVRWTAPVWNGGAAISKWYVYVYTDAEGTTLATGITNPQSFTGPTTTSGIVTGLTNGTTYWFQVSAENVKGEGAKSAMSAGALSRTVPDAPTLDSVVRGDRQFTLTVTAPTGDGGSAVTGYQYSTNGGTSWSNLTGSSPFTVLNQSGGSTRLVNGTTYSVKVRAVNIAGSGAASTAIDGTPATTPGAPTAVVATRGNDELALTWVAPAVTGGAAISNYRVTVYAADGVSAASGVTGDTTREVGSDTTSYTFTGLTNGGSYRFKVEAYNEVGWGAAASAASVAVVPNADYPPLSMSASPSAVGVSQDIGITITGTNLKAGATVTGDAKVTVSGVVAVDDSITLTITGVAAGTGRLSVVNPDHGIGWLDVTVTAPLDSLAIATGPAAIAQAATRTSITISGTGLQAGATLGSLPTGVTVSGTPTTVTNGRMTVTLVAAADAPLGAGTITLTNPDGGSATFPITVNPPPTITSVSPSQFGPGASGTPATLNGTGFYASTDVYVTGPTGHGTLTLDRAQYVSETVARLVVSVSSGALYAVWTLHVVNADGGTATTSLTVMPPLSVSSVDVTDLSEPAKAGGVVPLTKPLSPATYNDIMYITVSGVGIQQGASFKFSGSGLLVAAPVYSFNPATGEGSLTSRVRVYSTAAKGLRNVVVINPDRTTFTLANAAEVVDPSP